MMMAGVATVAAIAMGLIVGFFVGRGEASEPEHQPKVAFTAPVGCEGEIWRLASSVLRDMYKGEHRRSPFPILVTEELAAKGYSDPVTEVIDDLRGRPDLIPYPGDLGGIMAFRQARVLTLDRVLAEFDDGHYGGWALFAFEVRGPGEIEWTLVYASADGRDPVRPNEW
ncbi:MAG: hypothetical protein KAW61_08465 [candidate division Zixibacteria bacterium]|nr:hypothetical protein [candidate division Zixibacteria bacterium]